MKLSIIFLITLNSFMFVTSNKNVEKLSHYETKDTNFTSLKNNDDQYPELHSLATNQSKDKQIKTLKQNIEKLEQQLTDLRHKSAIAEQRVKIKDKFIGGLITRTMRIIGIQSQMNAKFDEYKNNCEKIRQIAACKIK